METLYFNSVVQNICRFFPGGGALPHLLISFGGTLLVVSILGMVYDYHLGLLLRSWSIINGALLVVSILGVVYDCRLGSLLRSWGDYWWFLWELWVFVGLGMALSRLWEACGLCPKSRAWREHAPRFPRFILLVSFSDTLLVVSILDIVYDCHLKPVLWPLLQS